MATSHICTNGKWKPGPVADCPKHTRLSKKQPSVYRSKDPAEKSSGSAPKDTPSASSSDQG